MTIYIGNAHKWLNKLPEQSVDCVVTSPPYYGLRSYVADDSPLKQEEIGLEETPEAYIENMVNVFRGIRRVLKDTGTAWLNLGDSYARQAGDDSTKQTDSKLKTGRTGKSADLFKKGINTPPSGYKPKDLMMIPHRVAIALQADGWWVRSDIIFHKPNPMPESVKDRPTKSKEYVFLLTKSERYFYDADAIREPHKDISIKRAMRGRNHNKYTAGHALPRGVHANTMSQPKPHEGYADMYEKVENGDTSLSPQGRNKRDVWTIATKPYSGAHFATMPQELAETCIKAGCPKYLCSDCGRLYEPISSNMASQYDIPTVEGYAANCGCNAPVGNGLVLDPFGGAGTTALAAIKLGRKYQLIELNPEYVGIAQKRIQAYNPYQPTTLPDGSKQLSLFSEAS